MSDNEHASDDFATMDDPEFLAERRRVRCLIEGTPEHEVSPNLTERRKALDEEFLRRARAAWQHSS